MQLAVIWVCAILLDRFLGEPPRWHPLVGFGWLVKQVERWCYGPAKLNAVLRMLLGAVSLLVLITPFALIAWGLAAVPYLGMVFEVGILYLALGTASLSAHARAVEQALAVDDLTRARAEVGKIVSRDTDTMDEEQISLATVESVLENGCDAIFGALFWFLLGGAPAVVAYRLANTLDAMWGYRTPRYCYFGWTAARLDDVLNWVPARLTALSYTLLGDRKTAWYCWYRQGPVWKSPNAGAVMAAGAGALGLQLGGTARYFGELVHRPPLGEGLLPRYQDIARALNLVFRTLAVWTALLVFGTLAWSMFFQWGVDLSEPTLFGHQR